ncbi:SMP-30/gluconolactonase/LRE family protein [Streptomyces sp. LX-29]|uniref:SMP-30/gluconolactonase/LRE family protein n=1 Tax=Streptomyces sp. LX-29 TaxID=2900152 RepID=UPI00240D25C7|nr:SMP-30/gluconolactonase/LRE family protein [Streptomyces sp. LX-29]WFB10893.1 SMP-30/gluconolactonase/LRE family protein [Streptomyces sp. LX-29]
MSVPSHTPSTTPSTPPRAVSRRAFALGSAAAAAVATVAAVGVGGPGAAAYAAPARARRAPGADGPAAGSSFIPLPGAEVFPESIAVDQAGGTFYVGSVKDGTIFRGKVGSDRVTVFSPSGADGRAIANGIALAGDRLIVLSRQTGRIYVYDTRTCDHLATLDNGLGGSGTFLNDLAVHRDGSAYVTDSINPWLYRMVPTGTGYRLERSLEFAGTPLQYVTAPGAAGINVNGIVATPDGRFLIVAKRNENALYRITLASRRVDRVLLPAGALETPDGIFLSGRTLYVAQNTPRSVAVLCFTDGDYAAATVRASIADPTFRFPTSVALHRDRLLVVSAQFDSKGSPAAVSGPNPPVLPFGVTEVPLR